MTRLTNTIRHKIVANAVEKATTVQNEEIKVLENTFSAELIKFATGDKIEELVKLKKQFTKFISTIPEEFLVRKDYDHINTDSVVLLNIAGKTVNWEFEDCVIFPKNNSCDRYVILADNPLSDMFDNIHNKKQKRKEIKETVRVNVWAVLNSVTTVKKLLEVWPESAELIPSEIEKPAINLPTVQIADLNNMIGVPTSAEV
jgi:hypothetical protein